MRCLIDTNIFLDVILERKEFMVDSEKVINIFEIYEKIHTGFLSSSILTDIYYIGKRKLSDIEMRKHLSDILLTFNLSDIDLQSAQKALFSSFDDFEDAVQNYSAMNADCDLIITRNKDDYIHSELEVMTPTEFISHLTNN